MVYCGNTKSKRNSTLLGEIAHFLKFSAHWSDTCKPLITSIVTVLIVKASNGKESMARELSASKFFPDDFCGFYKVWNTKLSMEWTG